MGFLLFAVIALGVIGAIAASASLSSIQKKFAGLGTLTGRTKEEIIKVVGPPTSISGLPNGKTLLQWQHISQAGGYHIALRFDDQGRCEGVTHEHSSRTRRF
jgi:hypothetical protein